MVVSDDIQSFCLSRSRKSDTLPQKQSASAGNGNVR